MSIHQTDEQLRDSVQREIEWEPAVTSKDISVKVKDGVVSLNGFANSFPEKMAAERAAKSVYGVTAIANDITVKPTTAHADPEIARDVQHAFKTHVLVPDDRITVTVRDGYVTLEGAVEWNYQRTSAEHAALTVAGVRNVANNIRIKPHVSPTMVKQRIEEALRRSAEVDARRIYVSAQDNKVELHGFVRSWMERDEAERAAWAAPGVSSVTDHLVVSP
ncbi:MAG: BON domain-containing protein [Acidobacteriaceae bacterium]